MTKRIRIENVDCNRDHRVQVHHQELSAEGWATVRTMIEHESDGRGCYPSLAALAAEIREINRANGWNVTQTEEWSDAYKVPAILALIHSEVSEAIEAFRKDDGENFIEEMADVLIRVLDCVGAFTDDFDAVVRAKLEKNRHRGIRHGGKRV